ncbi:MAG: hypothetical protein HKN33_13655 [Pyrinomonadaceae bacterium]|nr:hypothetical protein [Pyrinomonadaceae bacterium]
MTRIRASMSSRILGIYLVVISVLQIALYLYLSSGSFDLELGSREFVDPRIGWSILGHSLLGWLTAIWVFAIGSAFVLGRKPFVTYISTELILGLPQIVAAIPYGLINWSEGEGIHQGITQIILAVLFTVIPITWAIYLAIYSNPKTGDQ